MPDDPETRGFRFNLRHVFIAVTGLCVVLAAMARAAKQPYYFDTNAAIIASAMLALGTITLCVLRWRSQRRPRRSVIWIPLFCLFAGPALSLGYMVVGLSPEHYSLLLLPLLELGARIGVAVAVVFTTGLIVVAGLEKATVDVESFDKRIVILLSLFWSPIIALLIAAVITCFLG